MDYEASSLYGSSSEQFSNFNFAQAVAKILDNMGFSAVTGDALELLTSIMRRYFEDLTQRITFNKENGMPSLSVLSCFNVGGRQLPTLGDIKMAFKTQNVSLTELNDYIRQVQNLPGPPEVVLLSVLKSI